METEKKISSRVINTETPKSDKEVTIIDVRSTEEFSNSNATGSINIPINEFWKRMDELKKISSPLVLCCTSGGRSQVAHELLAAQGIKSTNGGACNNLYHFQTT